MVAKLKALMAAGSLKWSCRFSRGPLPVTMAWTKNPNMENIAYRKINFQEHLMCKTSWEMVAARQVSVLSLSACSYLSVLLKGN